MITLILPMPPKELSPNARVHFYKKSKMAASYKFTCEMLCICNDNLKKMAKDKPEKLHLNIIFNPKDKRKRDLDNLLSSFKYGIDAISKSIGIDDSNFTITISKSETFTNNIEVQIS